MASDYIEYFRRLYDRLPEALTVPFREVHLKDWKPALNDCHNNVDYWVKHSLGCTAVRGWIFWPADETGRCRFMAHSVVEEKGELVDITPIDRSTPRETLLFLMHSGTEPEFEAMKTGCSAVVYPPFTWEEWRECQTSAEIDEETDINL
jgi:hypothetical protein